MDGKDVGDSPSIKISDNVIMGDLNINNETKIIHIELPLTEKGLSDFIQSNWMNIINKYGSDKIDLDQHKVVLKYLLSQLKNYYMYSKSGTPFLPITKRYLEVIRTDPRILLSAQMQSELDVLRAIVSWKENDFDSFETILTNVIERITDGCGHNEIGLGIFEFLYIDPNFFLQSYENRPASLDAEEVVCMLATDAVCEFCFNPDFTKIHCKKLLRILAINHKMNPWHTLGSDKKTIWKNVRLDLIHDMDEGSCIWEQILEYNAFSSNEFEIFLRLILSEKDTLFPTYYGFEAYRFNLIKYSVCSIHSKINDLSIRINSHGKRENANEFLIREIFDWFELLAFISTISKWLPYEGEHSFRTRNDESANVKEWSIFWHLKQFVISFDSIIDDMDDTAVRSVVERQKDLPIRVFGSVNAINATYSFIPSQLGDGFYLPQSSLFSASFSNLLNFDEADFGTSWSMAIFHEKQFSLEPSHMPRWWSGGVGIDAHPDYSQTYQRWLDGTDIRKIQPPDLS